MPLLNRNDFPPGGFPYREPSLNWSAPADGAPFDIRVSQIQSVRAANPAATLSPDRRDCEAALDLYTCARLHNDPRWCAVVTNASARALPAPAKRVGCSFCPNKRRTAAAA